MVTASMFCVKGYDLDISHHQPAERLSFYCSMCLLICSVMAAAASLRDDSNLQEKEVGSTNIISIIIKSIYFKSMSCLEKNH